MTVKLTDVVEKVVVHDPNEEKITKLCTIQVLRDTRNVFLMVSCTEPDNYVAGQLFTVERGAIVAVEYETEREALQAVREVLHYVACHEADENLEYKGQRPFDPHSTILSVSDVP